WVLCAVIAGLGLPGSRPASAQTKSETTLNLKKPEMAQYQALTALVDNVMSEKEPPPHDVTLTFRSHAIKSSAGVFVPYLLEMSPDGFSSFPVALYVRAVAKAEPG